LLGGFNPYGYVFDPTGWVDPLGLQSCKVPNTDEKKVPNPNGKKGGEKHQAKVQEIKDDIVSRGMTAESEYRYVTPEGHKSSRYADVVALDSSGNVVEVYQVGRSLKKPSQTLQTEYGDIVPVSRERKAITDIKGSPAYNGEDVIYHAYDR
ncbi:TPA: hypothetical protein QB352_002358, partial [Pasteurella multocida]|nr:hypothetical protein [Pasteurella multocida]